jgi:hypothetical protein
VSVEAPSRISPLRALTNTARARPSRIDPGVPVETPIFGGQEGLLQ